MDLHGTRLPLLSQIDSVLFERMEYVIVLFLAGMFLLVGSFLWMVRAHVAMMQQNIETIKTLAMFKRANDTNDMLAMVDILNDPEKKPVKVEVEKERQFYPEELGAEGLAGVREQM